ncbi:acetate--CoA ligase family protein [Deltaproteobacteria bacterium]|nr:acetate--CoA ligase family protein [Deltaproteobacteria bacterium]
MNLERLFRPQSVAVFGGKWSDYVAQQCRKLGFLGEIWHVHPTRKDCINSTDNLPGVPDSVFLGINRDLTVKELHALRKIGIGGAVIFASGFNEEKDGVDYALKLDHAAGDIPYIGPNCYGFANFFDQVALWPDQVTGEFVKRGVAFISQSGTISITVMGQRRSLPVGYVITVGNQQRLAAEDVIRYCAADDRVTAIGLYLEGILDLQKFIDSVDHARSLGKPVALIKVGRSRQSQSIALTHTGALTGSDELHDELFERLGVARCETLSSLVETLKIFHCYGPLPSNRILVMGASGGDMSMVSDTAKDFDLDFSVIPEDKLDALKATVGQRVKLGNPLDFQTATWFDYSKLREMFDVLLKCSYAVTVLMLDPQDETEADTESFDNVIEMLLVAVQKKSAHAALMTSLPESLSRSTREKCLGSGVVPLQGLLESIEGLHHAAKLSRVWNEWSPPEIIPSSPEGFKVRTLNEFEAKNLLNQHQINVPKNRLASADKVVEAAEAIGFPVVLKAVVPEILHKTDSGGVALNLKNVSELSEALLKMSGVSDTFLVEEMITDCVAELILGVTADPQFGLTLILGAGGIFTELLKDSVILMMPLSKKKLKESIIKMRANKLLNGWRDQPEADSEQLVETVMSFEKFVKINIDHLAGCEINPLIVRPSGKGVVAADALIMMKEK